MLVVDDHEGIRRLLTEVLSSEGYSVEEASNGLQALARIRDSIPSLVLLDAKMPGKGGMEVLTEVNKVYSDLPVVLSIHF